MGKLAKGSNIMKLFPGENIIEALNIQEQQVQDLILITNKGSFVKHNTKEIKTSSKGEIGTMGIKFKDNEKRKDRLIDCFVNNKYVYIKTDKERYEKLETNQFNTHSYKKEKKLNIKLNENEYIESTFSIVLPEND